MGGSFFTDPTISLFFECPNCQRFLGGKEDCCPYCHELLNEEYKVTASAYLGLETQACSLANTIITIEPAIIILVIGNVFCSWVGLRWLLWLGFTNPLIILLAITRWWWRFGRFHLMSQDFLESKRKVFQSLLLWVAFIFFQALLIMFNFK